jgi:hypothetical protein
VSRADLEPVRVAMKKDNWVKNNIISEKTNQVNKGGSDQRTNLRKSTGGGQILI